MLIAFDLKDSYVDSAKYEPHPKRKGGLFSKLSSQRNTKKVEFDMKNDLFIIDEDPFEESSSLLKKSGNSFSSNKNSNQKNPINYKTKWIELKEISFQKAYSGIV